MSRLEQFAIPHEVSEEFSEDQDIQRWLWIGRIAFYFCLWVGMALPILLIVSVRF